MNKLKIAFLSAAVFAGQYTNAQITNPAPYCSGQYDDGAPFTIDVPHYISNVTIGTLNNTSGDTQYAYPHYVYYNNLSAPDLTKGGTYTLSVMHDPDSISGMPNTIHWIAAYIDFNHNNIFDSGELVLAQVPDTIVHLTNPTIATITIPSSALTGVTRLRVMVTEDDGTWEPTPCTADATGYMDWGETEDYNVNIVPNTTAVTIIAQNEQPEVYPNPATNNININDKFNGANITITDIRGRQLKTAEITAGKVDVSALLPGLYIIKITDKENVYTQRLSIER